MMAQAIGCDLCQQEPAVMMQSNLTNGDTLGVGEACMVTFYAASLTTMLHDAPPEALNALSPVLVPLGAIIGPDEWDSASDQAQAQGMGAVGEHVGDTEFIPDKASAESELDAARRLIADPSTYEDGNTEYGIEQALELAHKLVAEAEAGDTADPLTNADTARSEADQ